MLISKFDAVEKTLGYFWAVPVPWPRVSAKKKRRKRKRGRDVFGLVFVEVHP